jgi:hypothetical protein
MKPLILNFTTSPSKKNTDEAEMEYSEELNLTVIKGSLQPIIAITHLETQTNTRVGGEGADSDPTGSRFKNQLDTSTQTLNGTEGSDSDPVTNTRTKFLRKMVDTKTLTEGREDSDSDK